MFDGQMELSFGNVGGCGPRHQRRLGRAQWWFQRMRQVVDRAMDWQPLPPPRPQQTWLPGTYRQPGGISEPQRREARAGGTESQVCE
jgi:hypothetical protein